MLATFNLPKTKTPVGYLFFSAMDVLCGMCPTATCTAWEDECHCPKCVSFIHPSRLIIEIFFGTIRARRQRGANLWTQLLSVSVSVPGVCVCIHTSMFIYLMKKYHLQMCSFFLNMFLFLLILFLKITNTNQSFRSTIIVFRQLSQQSLMLQISNLSVHTPISSPAPTCHTNPNLTHTHYLNRLLACLAHLAEPLRSSTS